MLGILRIDPWGETDRNKILDIARAHGFKVKEKKDEDGCVQFDLEDQQNIKLDRGEFFDLLRKNYVNFDKAKPMVKESHDQYDLIVLPKVKSDSEVNKRIEIAKKFSSFVTAAIGDLNRYLVVSRGAGRKVLKALRDAGLEAQLAESKVSFKNFNEAYVVENINSDYLYFRRIDFTH